MHVENIVRALFEIGVVEVWNKVRVFLPSEGEVSEGPEKRLGRQVLMRFKIYAGDGKVLWLGLESREIVIG